MLASGLALKMQHRLGVGDAELWGKRLFMISPHHVQLVLLRRYLAELKSWDVAPFVDTVDKMQGQERDAVIVSYGVADVEYALSERAFIYSLNRLNVSITRARMKSVVFLPRPLLEPPIQALDNDDVAEGIAFMQGLRLRCEKRNDPEVVSVNGFDVTVLRG